MNEFQGISYRTEEEMFLAAARLYMSAGGWNRKDAILDIFEDYTDGELAKHCSREWFEEDVTEDLEQAFAEIRKDPAQHFGWEE